MKSTTFVHFSPTGTTSREGDIPWSAKSDEDFDNRVLSANIEIGDYFALCINPFVSGVKLYIGP